MDKKNIVWVLFAGAVGGLVAWLVAAQASGSVGLHWAIDLAAGILGGAVAGAIGVFLLANTDPNQFAKFVTFALVCGLSWQAILAAGKNLVVNAQANKEVTKATEKIDQGLAKNSPNSAEIQSLATNTNKLSEKLSSVVDSNLRKEAVQTATKAVDKLEIAATDKPEAVAALEDIGKRAAANGSKTIEFAAKESLRNISTSEKAPEETRRKAALAATALSASQPH
jgi:hypothetical protein